MDQDEHKDVTLTPIPLQFKDDSSTGRISSDDHEVARWYGSEDGKVGYHVSIPNSFHGSIELNIQYTADECAEEVLDEILLKYSHEAYNHEA